MSAGFNLVLDDKYIHEMSTFFINTSEKAEMQLEGLINALQNACADGISEGKTAEVLADFTEKAAMLKNRIREYGSECSKQALDFLESVDDADSFNLY